MVFRCFWNRSTSATSTEAAEMSTLTAPRQAILLSCGSFNPPTLAHLRMMEVYGSGALGQTPNFQVARDYLQSLPDPYVVREGETQSVIRETSGTLNCARHHVAGRFVVHAEEARAG